jgi:hypothetical protein
MSIISGYENHPCGTSLRKSYKISLKDHAHGIDYHQQHGAGTTATMSISLIHLHE